MMYLIQLLSLWSLVCVSSTMTLGDKFSVLLCKQQCKSYGKCTSILYENKNLRCALIFGNNSLDTKKPGYRLFEVQSEASASGCSGKERIVFTRVGSLKCVKAVFEAVCVGILEKKMPCRKTATVDTSDDGPRCILLRRENITVRHSVQLVELNMRLKPGMKMVVYGGSVKSSKSSHLTISKTPENPTNPMKWYHINLNWDRGVLDFEQIFRTTTYKGGFPISDRSHFTLAFEVTQLKMKIYADNIQVKTIDVIPGLREFNVRFFSGIHVLLVQKNNDECKNVSNGIS